MSKYGKYLMFAAMAAMMGPGIGGDRPTLVEEPKPLKNNDLKCFREGCNKRRHGNKLYCSSECCKLNKQKK
jgi:hypothetical protein